MIVFWLSVLATSFGAPNAEPVERPKASTDATASSPSAAPNLKTSTWIVSFDPSVDPEALPYQRSDLSIWTEGRTESPSQDGVKRTPTTGLARQMAASKFKVEAGGCVMKLENGNLVTTPEKATPPWKIIGAPKIISAINQDAEIAVGRPIAFLEKGGDDCLQLKYAPDAREGLTLKLRAERIEARESRFSNIEVKVSQVTGRQPVEGVPLDVGRPIIDTRETSLSLTIAVDQVAVIPLPQAPGEPAVLIFLMAAMAD